MAFSENRRPAGANGTMRLIGLSGKLSAAITGRPSAGALAKLIAAKTIATKIISARTQNWSP
jgi:hypothetical protein